MGKEPVRGEESRGKELPILNQANASYPESHLIYPELISNHLNTLGLLHPLKGRHLQPL